MRSGASCSDTVIRTLFLSVTTASNRALLTQVLDQPLSAHSRIVVESRGITEIEFVGNIGRGLRVNETQHLDAIQTATEKKKTEIPVPTQTVNYRTVGVA